MNKKQIGEQGERFASQLLQEKGFLILQQNYHSRYGEIDLIVADRHYIVFAEVKTRTVGCAYSPAQAVTISKQRKLIKTAMFYLAEHPMELQPRFDVIEILAEKGDFFRAAEYTHIENAFLVEDINAIF